MLITVPMKSSSFLDINTLFMNLVKRPLLTNFYEYFSLAIDNKFLRAL